MIRRIPQNHRWSGPYLGSYYGDLWKTFNVDLDRNEGKIGLSERMERIEDTTEILDLTGDAIRVFVRTNADCEDRYWSANRIALFKTDSSSLPTPSLDWDTDGLASTPTAGINDMTVHGNDSRNDSGRNKLFVTTDSDIYALNDTGNNVWTANWWVTKQGQAGFDTNYTHPIEYFSNRKISLVGDGNLIHTISRPSDSQNDTVTRSRIVLPRDLIVYHIFTTSERAWICCYDRKLNDGAIVEWDGYSQSPNAIHSAYSMGVFAGVNVAGSPIVLNSKGVFLEFTGQGFAPIIRNGQQVALPVSEEQSNGMYNPNGTFLIRSRSMVATENGLVYINVMRPSLESPRQGGGIWCLNPASGRLYNKYSLGAYGDSTDYGQQSAATVPGALYWVDNAVSQRNLLAGGGINTSAGTTATGIWLMESVGGESSSNVNRGYFITQYIPADGVKEFWDSLWVRFKQLRTSGNSIVLKARGGRQLVAEYGVPLQKTITWTSTTTFTVTLGSADDPLSVGDEIEVVSGVNAGYIAHITTISGTHGAIQTITIDEAVKTGSSTSTARFDWWKKIGTITSTSTYEQKINVGIDSSFIQFKVELRGVPVEVEVSDLVSISGPSIQLEN